MNVCTCDTHLPHVYFGARDERSYVALPKTNWKHREGWETNHSTGQKNSTITGVHNCYGNVSLKRGTWSYPRQGVSELRLEDQLVSGGRGWERGLPDRELERPWLQIPWSRFSECLAEPRGFPGGQEPPVWVWVTWGSFCWVYSSWWSNYRALGIWSQETRPIPSQFPPVPCRKPRNLVSICSFSLKTFPISYCSGGFSFNNGKHFVLLLTKNVVHIVFT